MHTQNRDKAENPVTVKSLYRLHYIIQREKEFGIITRCVWIEEAEGAANKDGSCVLSNYKIADAVSVHLAI